LKLVEKSLEPKLSQVEDKKEENPMKKNEIEDGELSDQLVENMNDIKIDNLDKKEK
jgi:hypothetical protein